MSSKKKPRKNIKKEMGNTAYMANWRRNNKERWLAYKRAYAKKWRKNNPDKYLESQERQRKAYAERSKRYKEKGTLLKILGENATEKIKHINPETYEEDRDESCSSCGILLSSKFAIGGNKLLCGHCLKDHKEKK